MKQVPEHNPGFDLEELARKWPSPLVARSQHALDRFSGGILNARTLANADSLGTGPSKKIQIGRKVAYPADSLVEWMKARVREGEAI